MSMNSSSATERLRSSFRPDNVRLLLVGESAPSNGTFFYDDRNFVDLRSHIMKAFSNALGTSFAKDAEFLRFFKDAGCYLDDLCLTPVNDMDINSKERSQSHKQAVNGLAERMRDYSPEIIFVMMKGIKEHVGDARRQAGLQAIPLYSAPFPAFNQKNINGFVSELENVLTGLKRDGFFDGYM
jgi:hypothetical protein